jgi:hypothetical protein
MDSGLGVYQGRAHNGLRHRRCLKPQHRGHRLKVVFRAVNGFGQGHLEFSKGPLHMASLICLSQAITSKDT